MGEGKGREGEETNGKKGMGGKGRKIIKERKGKEVKGREGKGRKVSKIIKERKGNERKGKGRWCRCWIAASFSAMAYMR